MLLFHWGQATEEESVLLFHWGQATEEESVLLFHWDRLVICTDHNERRTEYEQPKHRVRNTGRLQPE